MPMIKLFFLVVYQIVVIGIVSYFTRAFHLDRYYAVLAFLIVAYLGLRVFIRLKLGVWTTRFEPLWGPYYAFVAYLISMGLGLRGFWPFVVPGIFVVGSLVWLALLLQKTGRPAGAKQTAR